VLSKISEERERERDTMMSTYMANSYVVTHSYFYHEISFVAFSIFDKLLWLANSSDIKYQAKTISKNMLQLGICITGHYTQYHQEILATKKTLYDDQVIT
jgi:hypothetical protein